MNFISNDAAVGRLLEGGRYRLEQCIGSGGMGAVYRAVDTRLGVERAIKLIVPPAADPLALPEEARDRLDGLHGRLITEAIAAQRLSALTPHVVQVYDVGRCDETGEPFLVMERLDGETLELRLAYGGPMAVGEALGHARVLAQTLGLGHQMNILHRDLKPSNVMLARRGAADDVLVVLDFGLAYVQHPGKPRTRTGEVLGTVPYMAPERFQNVPLSPAADVFAIGAILYELLAGIRAVPADDDVAAFRTLVEDGVVPIRERVPGLPAAVAAMVDQCLRRRPHTRPTSGSALASALDGLIRRLGEAELAFIAPTPGAALGPSEASGVGSVELGDPVGGGGRGSAASVDRADRRTDRRAGADAADCGDLGAKSASAAGAMDRGDPRDVGRNDRAASVDHADQRTDQLTGVGAADREGLGADSPSPAGAVDRGDPRDVGRNDRAASTDHAGRLSDADAADREGLGADSLSPAGPVDRGAPRDVGHNDRAASADHAGRLSGAAAADREGLGADSLSPAGPVDRGDPRDVGHNDHPGLPLSREGRSDADADGRGRASANAPSRVEAMDRADPLDRGGFAEAPVDRASALSLPPTARPAASSDERSEAASGDRPDDAPRPSGELHQPVETAPAAAIEPPPGSRLDATRDLDLDRSDPLPRAQPRALPPAAAPLVAPPERQRRGVVLVAASIVVGGLAIALALFALNDPTTSPPSAPPPALKRMPFPHDKIAKTRTEPVTEAEMATMLRPARMAATSAEAASVELPANAPVGPPPETSPKAPAKAQATTSAATQSKPKSKPKSRSKRRAKKKPRGGVIARYAASRGDQPEAPTPRKRGRRFFEPGGTLALPDDTPKTPSIPAGTQLEAQLTVGITSSRHVPIVARTTAPLVVNGQTLAPVGTLLQGRSSDDGEKIYLDLTRLGEHAIRGHAVTRGQPGLQARKRKTSTRERGRDAFARGALDTAGVIAAGLGAGVAGDLARNVGREAVGEAQLEVRPDRSVVLEVPTHTPFTVVITGGQR